MAATDEIAIKLNIRIDDFKKALADANASVRTFSKEGEKNALTLGNVFGELGKKAGGLQGVTSTLATALGINLERIAENVARLFAGLSKTQEEYYKRADQLSDQNTEKFLAALRARRTGEQNYQLDLQEQEKLLARLNSNSLGLVEKTYAVQTTYGAIKVVTEQVVDEAKRLVEIEETKAKLLEVGARLAAHEAEKKKEAAEARKKELDEETKQFEVYAKAAEDRFKQEKATADLIQKNADAEAEALDQRIEIARAELPLAQQKEELMQNLLIVQRDIANGLDLEFDVTKEIAKETAIKTRLREIEKGLADEQLELARLLLIPEEKRSDVDRERIKLLSGQTSIQEQQREKNDLLARGVQNLTNEERQRLLVLEGQTAEIAKAANEAERQARALQAHFNTSIRNEGDLGSLSNDALKELTAVIKKQLAQSEAETLHQRQPTVLEAGFLAQLESIKVELEKRRDFQQVSKFMSQAGLEVKFGQSEFSRLSQLFNVGADAQKQTATAVTRMETILARVFPDAARNAR